MMFDSDMYALLGLIVEAIRRHYWPYQIAHWVNLGHWRRLREFQGLSYCIAFDWRRNHCRCISSPQVMR